MARIDLFIFGYRRYKTDKSVIAEISSEMLRRGISAVMKDDGSFLARERDRSEILIILKKYEFEESRPLGLFGAIKRFPHKIALTLGIIISAITVLYSSSLVWDIRVEGNEGLTDVQVISELEKCGFSIGESWASLNCGEVELRVLAQSEDIGWISINRRGTVAYVTVIEKEKNKLPEKPDEAKYGNIVADRDCVIEEITVKRGQAMVKEGETVKKGDILILGALPAEAGGGLCRAEGTVIGRSTEVISIEVGREYERKRESDVICESVTLNIFGRKINIYKNYGNLPDVCVIIEEISTVSLLGRYKLPITLERCNLKVYETEHLLYSDEELVCVAVARLRAKTAERLEHADLLKIRTDGHYTENGYIATNSISVSDSVASFVEIIFG